MSDILHQLRVDHVNFAGLLNRLETQLGRIHDLEHAALELMQDMMRYLTHYPDLVHHPREDLLFETLLARDDGIRSTVDELVAEHGALAEQGTRFLAILESVIDGALVPRETLEARGRDYVAALRAHMRREEAAVFQAAADALHDADWAAIEARDIARPDPLFGAIVEQEYRELFEHIQRDR